MTSRIKFCSITRNLGKFAGYAAALALATGFSSAAQAHGHFAKGAQVHVGAPVYYGQHGHGHGYWHHGWNGPRYGWWWVAGPSWTWYAAPVYPYPAYAEPLPAAPLVSGPPPVANWYYCEAAKGYYPYVASCAGGWRVVPATPPQQ